MTPNPQNIGAAHEEYPIRALVLAYNPSLLHPDMLGTVRQWRQSGSDSFETRCNLPNCCGGENTWVARGNAITIDPTPEQIAEERAKAGLPPPDAVGVPEPQAKGHSLPEVTQPGEGVELEALLTPDLMARIREYAAREEEGVPDNANMDDAYYSGSSDGKRHLSQAILDVLKARATLRRESK